MRGRCPYHYDVLILDTMLALKHAFYIQILKLYFSFLWFSRLEEHLNLIHPFKSTKLVETCGRYIILLHLVFLQVFYHIFGTNHEVCKDICGDYQLKLMFAIL